VQLLRRALLGLRFVNLKEVVRFFRRFFRKSEANFGFFHRCVALFLVPTRSVCTGGGFFGYTFDGLGEISQAVVSRGKSQGLLILKVGLYQFSDQSRRAQIVSGAIKLLVFRDFCCRCRRG
jgi:hypothetical protein